MAVKFNLSEEGEKALEDLGSLPPEVLLVLWIVKKCPNIEKENCRMVWTEIMEHFNWDADEALLALENGSVQFEFTPYI